MKTNGYLFQVAPTHPLPTQGQSWVTWWPAIIMTHGYIPKTALRQLHSDTCTWREDNNGNIDSFPWWQRMASYIILQQGNPAWCKGDTTWERKKPRLTSAHSRDQWTPKLATALLTNIRHRFNYCTRREDAFETGETPDYRHDYTYSSHCTVLQSAIVYDRTLKAASIRPMLRMECRQVHESTRA